MYMTPAIVVITIEETTGEMRINCAEPNYCSYTMTYSIPGGGQCAVGFRYCAMGFEYHPSICSAYQTYYGG